MGKSIKLNSEEKSIIYFCLDKNMNDEPDNKSKIEMIKQELGLRFGRNYLKQSLRAIICGSIRQYFLYPLEEFIFENYKCNANRTKSDIEKITEINLAINILEKMKVTKKIEEIKIPI